jgi:hypothetical protein
MTSLHVFAVFRFQSRRHPSEPMSDFFTPNPYEL